MPTNGTGLFYAGTAPKYVGKPIAELGNLLSYKEEQYATNVQAANILEQSMSAMQVLDQDEHIKDDANIYVKSQFDQIYENGDWENASAIVRNTAKNVAMDQKLNMAITNKQLRDAHLANLTKLVGDKDHPILQSDIDYVMAMGDAQYKGVHHNLADGQLQGKWQGMTPPKFIDRGQYIDNFLKEFKPDERFGQFIKKNDGWYKVRETAVTPGSHEIAITTERADYTELYSAARSHMMQNQEIVDRINFETAKDQRTFSDIQSKDPNARKALINDLADVMGFDRKNLNTLSDDDLFTMYKKESQVYESIKGPVAKNSYVKEDITPLGLTYEAQMELAKQRSASKKTDDKVEDARILLQNKGIPFINAFGYPETIQQMDNFVSETAKLSESLDKDVKDIQNDIDKRMADLKAQGKSDTEISADPYIENQRRNLDETKFKRNEQIFVAEMNKQRFDRVVQDMLTEGKMSRDEYQRFTDIQKVVDAEMSTAEKNSLSNTENLINQKAQKYFSNGELKNPFEEAVYKGIQESIKNKQPLGRNYYGAASKEYRETAKIILGEETYKAYNEAADKYQAIQATVKPIKDKIDRALTSDAKSSVIETAYVNIGLGYGDIRSDWSKESRFAVTVKNDFEANKEGWIIFDESGKRLYEDKPAGKRNSDIKSVNIIGMTTEPVGNYGYLIAANITTPDGKSEKNEFVYMKPSTGYSSNMIEAAKSELLSGNNELIGKDVPGAAQSAVDLARKWDKYMLDESIARFNDYPIRSNTSRTLDIPLGYNGMYARVTRVVPNYIGNTKYQVSILNEDGTVNTEVMGGNTTTDYADRFKLEGDLEQFQGKQLEQRYNVRTDRHNNPTAMTTGVAKAGGLVEGVDYEQGMPFTGSDGKTYYTANIKGDGLEKTIKVIDKAGFKLADGTPRWSYIKNPDEMETRWKTMSKQEKYDFIQEMNKYEEGVQSIFHK